MKTFRLIFIVLLMMTLSAKAQVTVNVNINTPPAWGPIGYTESRYYYIPDIEVYYDIPSAMFIYFDGGGWIRAAYLPYRHRHYDLYNAYKVCLNDYGPNPYVYYKQHKVKYYRGYRGPYQRTIGTRPQVVYNGPRDGYRQERNDNDRNEYYRNQDGNRGERKHNEYRTDYKSSGNNYTRNNNGHGRGNEGNGRGNGNGRENGNGNGGGRGHGQRG